MQTGDRLDARYRLDGVLGEGGMGVVYRAFDERLERPVAVKVLAGAQGDAPEARLRFLREARRTAQLRHPNLVEVFDVGETEAGEPFFVMELLAGEPLSAFAEKKGALDLPTFSSVALPICQAVAAAHASGVVHRDLKPGNVMIVSTSPVRIKVLDFGIYKESGASAVLTSEGSFVGTVGYAAPEQIRGEKLDARADVYSLGVIFYELLAGASLFDGGSLATQLHHHLSVQPRALDDRIPGVPKTISAAIMRALAKPPERRFASAGAFAEALGTSAPAPNGVVLEEMPEQEFELELDIAPRPLSSFPQPHLVTGAPLVAVSPFQPAPSYGLQFAPPPAILAPLGVLPVSVAKRVSVYSFFAAVLAVVFFHAGTVTVAGFVLVGGVAGVNWWVRRRLDECDRRRTC